MEHLALSWSTKDYPVPLASQMPHGLVSYGSLLVCPHPNPSAQASLFTALRLSCHQVPTAVVMFSLCLLQCLALYFIPPYITLWNQLMVSKKVN